MPDDLDIGGERYGLREAMQLRGEVMIMRDSALMLEKPNMHAAVLLSHVIGLIYALTRAKWPMQFSMLASSFEARGGRAPAKYGDVTLDMQGVVEHMNAMEQPFESSWYAFLEDQSLENWSKLNEGVLRLRLLMDIARELVDEKRVKEEGGGHA